MANDFFKNGDKGYTENLNDSVLLGNAFDWTVNIGLPTDTGDIFPNSSTVSKAKVCDVSITPNSNLSIGSTISNSSGSSQVYRLTVYPNFNRFGGFQSISLDADSGVTFYIANKGGNSPISNNLNYTNLSNVPELKVLKEYDIVVTIPTGKSVSGLSFVLQSKPASVSGSIAMSNVTDLNTTIEKIEKIELTANNYNPTIDSNVTISAHFTDIDGNNISGRTVQLCLNGTSLGESYSATTNSSGIATFTYTCTTWGVQDFSVENVHCQVRVTGWKSINVNNGTLYVNGETRVAELHYSKSGADLTANTWTFVETLTQVASYPPVDNNLFVQCSNPTVIARVYATGSIQANTSASGTYAIAFTAMWHF